MTWLERRSADGDSYLPDMVRLLWPTPAQHSTGHRRPGGGGRSLSYLVVPSARRPKLLVPAAPRTAAAAALRGFKSTQERGEGWLLGLLALGFRLGSGAVLPDRLCVTIPHDAPGSDIVSYLEQALHRTVHVSLHVSAPRAVRKPVLQLIDDAGRTFAFAKVAIDDFTDMLVRAETDTVSGLAGRRWRVLRLPRVLHAGSWQGRAVLVQEALPRAAGPGDERLVAAAMDELARAEGTTACELAASSFGSQLLARVSALPAGPLREAIGASLRELGDAAAVPLEFGAWHGDWTPWNMNACAGRVQVWDWERYATGVPIGFDAAHCFVQRAVIRQARAPADVFAQLIADPEPLRAAHRLSRSAARLVVWAYALNIAVTYLEDREPQAGTAPLTRLDDWLAPTLRRAATSVTTS